jgi:hypothetical protein
MYINCTDPSGTFAWSRFASNPGGGPRQERKRDTRECYLPSERENENERETKSEARALSCRSFSSPCGPGNLTRSRKDIYIYIYTSRRERHFVVIIGNQLGLLLSAQFECVLWLWLEWCGHISSNAKRERQVFVCSRDAQPLPPEQYYSLLKISEIS